MEHITVGLSKQSKQLCNNLSQIVGETGIHPDPCQIDEIRPQAVVSPSSVREIQDILAFATEHQLSIIPVGAGTKLGIGNPPEKVDLVLLMEQFSEVLEYEPADLSVTVQAGVRLSELQGTLAEEGQYLPLDPPYAADTTLGGLVAANASGPSRLRYGTARNRVLGMKVVQPSGAVVNSGGKVVKNVAGYDLKKLYIGSFGTLGIITELTFNLYPLPELERTLLLRFKTVGDAAEVALKIANSQLSPVFLNLFTDGALSTAVSGIMLSGTIIALGIDGHPETVAWQINQVQSIAKEGDAIGVEVLADTDHADLRSSMCAFPEVGRSSQDVVCKANLRMTDVEGFVNTTLETLNTVHVPVQMMGLMGNGVVYIAISEGSEDTDTLQSIAKGIVELREYAIGVGGSLIIESAPLGLKRQVDVWGPVGNSTGLMKTIKARLDPVGLLNPGRFVEGI
jgi:glycolate oxidase FAD binding subunit